MTLLYTQGFEGFPSTGEDRTDLDMEFNFHDTLLANEAGIIAGRTGGLAGWTLNGSNTDSSFRLPVSGYSQTDDWIVGFAFYVNYNWLDGPANESAIVRFVNPGGTDLCSVTLRSGAMHVRTGSPSGTVIGFASANVLAKVWYFFECKVKFATGTSGQITIRLNEQQVFQNLACNTGSTATTLYPGEIRFGQAGADVGIWIDDVYVCDDQGSSHNDFLGDITLEGLDPNGAGTTSQFTAFPGAGANYLEVDEDDVDDDTTYVESRVAAEKDTYAYSNLSGTPAAIEAVSVKSYCKKSDGGTRTFVHIARSSAGAEADSAVLYPSAGSYRHLQSHFLVDPTTGVAWTAANVNGAEFGFKVNA